MTTALITGGAGFVGGYLREHLRAQGWETASFDLRDGHDVRSYEQVRFAVDALQPDYVFHLAAQAYVAESGMDPERTLAVNVTGTHNLLLALRNTGCRARVLLAGTSEEYGYEHQPGPEVTEDSPTRPTTAYGTSKLAATHLGLVYAQAYGMPIVVTRAFNHTGPGRPPQYADSAFARRVVAVERGQAAVVAHGNLEAVRNYTDVRDIVRAYRLAIDLPSGIYNLCSDYTVPMAWILNTLLGAAEGTVPTRQDDALWRPSGSAVFHPPSAVRFHALTGWKPQIPLEQTLAEVLDYWRGQP
ncbi:GDP-mannose 4,6-dehydratase [Rhizomonospora bruguierae]|uniref:GDP-mannose 4,6-dehydratase n=1 Tax=Rhizomonospora bruguierae TaxID=1581705 RepID=UPI001BD04A11|nr:GDP-mannose 4,6-dehydratase [Micromonospora sp. NBRC 107566]